MTRLSLFALAVCLLLGVSTHRILDAQQASPVTPPAAAPATPPAGYAGSDTCALCHDDRATEIARTLHGQVRNARTPAANLGCESCHGPGQAHVDDDAKGHIRKFGEIKPAEI